MEKIVSLCKRRGLIFPASEIYGGIANTYDYGHYGVLLKNNVDRPVVEGDDPGARRHRRAGLGDHPAPAHVGGLGPPRRLHRPARGLPHLQARFRADHLEEARAGTEAHDLRCGRAPSKLPGEHADCDLTAAREFNLMFETTHRPGQGRRLDRLPAPGDRPGHLPQLQDHAAVLAQASRRSASRRSASRSATRSPRATSSSARSSSSRWRWSSSCRPTRPQQWHEHWLQERLEWYVGLGIDREKLRLRAHDADELSHYSSATSDVEYLLPDRLVGARGHRQPRRLRPAPARRSTAARSSSTSTRRPRSATSRT